MGESFGGAEIGFDDLHIEGLLAAGGFGPGLLFSVVIAIALAAGAEGTGLLLQGAGGDFEDMLEAETVEVFVGGRGGAGWRGAVSGGSEGLADARDDLGYATAADVEAFGDLGVRLMLDGGELEDLAVAGGNGGSWALGPLGVGVFGGGQEGLGGIWGHGGLGNWIWDLGFWSWVRRRRLRGEGCRGVPSATGGERIADAEAQRRRGVDRDGRSGCSQREMASEILIRVYRYEKKIEGCQWFCGRILGVRCEERSQVGSENEVARARVTVSCGVAVFEMDTSGPWIMFLLSLHAERLAIIELGGRRMVCTNQGYGARS